MNDEKIYFVFKNEGPFGKIFVEVEDKNGKSIEVGKFIPKYKNDYFCAIAVSANDILKMHRNNKDFIDECTNTVKATGLELFLAKLFGKKAVGEDSGCKVTIHHYKGKSYLTSCRKKAV